MIKLNRIRTEEAIHANFRGEKRVEFEKDLLSEHKKAGSFTPDPLNNNEGLDMSEFIRRHKDERLLLINPYIDDPQNYFAWNVDTTLEEVELIPVRNNDFSEKYVKAAENAYGLNRDELKKLRYEIYLQYSTHKLYVNATETHLQIKAKSQAIINRMLGNDKSYSGMLKYFENIPVTELP